MTYAITMICLAVFSLFCATQTTYAGDSPERRAGWLGLAFIGLLTIIVVSIVQLVLLGVR